MRQNRNNEYWRKRFELLEQAEHKKATQYFHDLDRIYGRAVSNCEAEISKWYQRVAVNNQISYQEAQKLLSKDELREFKWSVDEYIKHGEENKISGKWIKELENASARVHISRLEAMKVQMQHQIECVSGQEIDGLSKLIESTYTDSYYRSIFEIQKYFGVGDSFSVLDNKTVAKVISEPWTADGMTFSERVWGKHRPELITKLQNDLAYAFIRGDNPIDLVSKIRNDFRVTKNQAENLALTESAFFRAAGTRQSYKELGINKYEINGTLDGKTCGLCQDMDGLVFDLSEMVLGVNHPPFHCRCRCTSIPYFNDEFTRDETRAARNDDGKYYTVPAEMKYPEWKAKYVDEPKGREYNEFKERVYKDIKNNYILSINQGQQDKHIPGTNNYIEGRSILTADPERLIDMYAGKSTPIWPKNGVWNNKEQFTHTEIIGIFVKKDGTQELTKNGIIHYSKKKGVHIVPARPKGDDVK